MGWFDEGNGGTPIDVAAMLDSKSAEMIHELVAVGALVSLGLTSDGGALALTVTVDGAWRREYFREAGQMELWLEQAMAPVTDACLAKSASSGSRSRSRSARGR